MNLIANYDEFLKMTRATFFMQDQIIKDKLTLGINGIEWLVLQINTEDEALLESLDSILHSRILEKFNKEELFIDSLRLSEEEFFGKYSINYFVVQEEAIAFLALQKRRNYSNYLRLLSLAVKHHEST